jgi:glucosamine-phosphate N-acetyltransferase
MADTTPLFDASLIPTSVSKLLPEGYVVQPLSRADFNEGFLDVLRVLTTVGDVDEKSWMDRYDWLSKHNDEYYLIVIRDENRPAGEKVVGTGALVVERKL